MKFTKFGKALLISALSAGVILSVTSCVRSYSVGYLYVMGTVTSQSNGNGIISGFKIDHNTGKLIAVNGLPVASGGSNPIRAILLDGSRYLYVLNRGISANPAGTSECTTQYPCSGGNITQFAVGANGILTAQQTFYTQGINPMRMMADGSGSYLYVLDHDAPNSAACPLALGGTPTSCGDITVFQVDSNTGRLQLKLNNQVKVLGQNLTYFPVPANPIDFVYASSNILTLFGTPSTGDAVFAYQASSVDGQLTLTSNSSDTIGNVHQATAIVVSSGGPIYVLDNEPPSPNPTNAASQVLPFSFNSNSLQAEASGPIPINPSLANPTYLLNGAGSASKWLYVANQGNNTPNKTASGIAGYVLNGNNPATELAGSPFGSGSGPQCLVEDPSNQFFYTANFNDSTVTGTQINQQSGGLRPLSDATHAPNSYKLTGQPTWCLIDGRTN